jgi:hypothetical protein
VDGFTYPRTGSGSASEKLLLPSPFHYRDRALLYVPKGMPEPIAPSSWTGPPRRWYLVDCRAAAPSCSSPHANMNAVAGRIAAAVPY